MSSIDKEWLQQKISEMEATRDEIPFGLDEDDSNTLAAMRIALASLEAEPVAYMYKDKLHTDARFSLHTRFGNWSQEDINEYEITEIPLYTAPPAPVSESEPMKMFGIGSVFKPKILSGDEVDCDNCAHYQPNVCHGEGCPAAMLQGKADVSLTHEGNNHHEDKLGMVDHSGDANEKVNIPVAPVTQFKPVADLYGLTSPTGSETSFTFDAVEARDFVGGGWSCQEYVELERFQEAVSGNSPVIPDGWVIVPVDMSPEMMRAVQINSELGAYSATNLTGAYSLFREFWDVAIAAAPLQEVKP
ncbi:hypothetical protein QCD67_00315 [Enterobacter roggenkampii]|uniref:hypothetical protein n=1 Tax=Enterobacter roggenkampii TaxID=1812935 RepID=UPI00244BA09A|nr:hypothetical protein [Enterobacter roggenkampii]WGG55718.1 hypothetical protein QCD67_00315 [Enterobacter roggenkampii]